MYIAPKYWLGNAASGDHLSAAIAQYAAMQAAGKFEAASGSPTREQMGLAPLYNLQQGVGIITISGSLIFGEAGYMAMFGATGYDDIRAAVAQAVQDPEAKTLMLHVASGGGMVSGVEDLGSFLEMAASMKPMSTYADGVMASAAYWLGSYGSHIATNQTSLLGSLGVLMVHMDESAQLAKDGITATVIRSGAYKALNNSYEPLSDTAKAELQLQADTMYSVFMNAVSTNRKVPYAVADQSMGQGREFLGAAAVKVGLADALMTYEQALAYSKSLDTSSKNSRNSKGAPAMKVTLNATQLAAYASGATLLSLGFPAGAEVEISATAEPLVLAPAAEAIEPAPEVIDPAIALAAAVTERDGFKASLDTAAAAQSASTLALAAMQLSVTALTAERDAYKALQEPLVSIARASTGKMLLALGGSQAGVAVMEVGALLAEHHRASEIFAKRFVPGGVAAPSKAGDKVEPGAMSAAYLSIIRSGPNALNAAARK